MDDFKDPLLLDKEISTQDNESRFSSIGKNNLRIVGGYLEIIWRVKATNKMNVPIDEVIENVGIFFMNDNIIKVLDTLWMQHCASSLRELVASLQIPEDFLCALKCLPPATKEDGSQTQEYIRLRKFEQFFHSITHFENNKILLLAKEITGDTKLQKINDETFENICTRFIEELYNLFSTNCMKHKRSAC